LNGDVSDKTNSVSKAANGSHKISNDGIHIGNNSIGDIEKPEKDIDEDTDPMDKDRLHSRNESRLENMEPIPPMNTREDDNTNGIERSHLTNSDKTADSTPIRIPKSEEDSGDSLKETNLIREINNDNTFKGDNETQNHNNTPAKRQKNDSHSPTSSTGINKPNTADLLADALNKTRKQSNNDTTEKSLENPARSAEKEGNVMNNGTKNGIAGKERRKRGNKTGNKRSSTDTGSEGGKGREKKRAKHLTEGQTTIP